MKKIWCLHCEKISMAEPDNEGIYVCPECGAWDWDVEIAGTGFTSQAYPEIKYEEYEVGKVYPLYPDSEDYEQEMMAMARQNQERREELED